MAFRGKALRAIRSRWPSILSAVLFLAAFPPFDLWPLIFVALVPMLFELRHADSKGAWRIGYVFGSVLFLGQMYWLYVLTDRWTHSAMLALIPWLLTAAAAGLFYGWVARLIRHCYIRGWLVLIPVAWTGIEVFRSYIPVLAFPWALAATPLYRTPVLIQSAHYGTIYLVSAFVVLVNVVLTTLPSADTRAQFRPVFIALLGLAAMSLRAFVPRGPSEPFPVSVGQPGVDMAFGNPSRARTDIAENVEPIVTDALAHGSRLLILPEGVGLDDHYPPQPPFAIDKRVPVLFGGQRSAGLTYQTAYSFDGHWHYADKTRLVIMGEFVPGRSLFPWLATAFDLPSGDLSASKDGVRAVDVGPVKAGPMLCFEALFPDVAYHQAENGASFIAVMCIDDWYMGTPAPEQLQAASYFRAVETGLPLVRSASLGRTLAVDGDGTLLGELPLKHAGALEVTLHLPKKSTYFPLLPVFPIAAVLFALVLPWLPKAKPQATEGDSHSRP